MAIEKADKKTIGVIPANESTLTALAKAGHFRTDIDAAKFALAHAVSRSVSSGAADGAATKWNVGSFDSDGSLKAVIEALFPDEAYPYRTVEHLINEGLRLLNKGDNLPPDVAGMVAAADKS